MYPRRVDWMVVCACQLCAYEVRTGGRVAARWYQADHVERPQTVALGYSKFCELFTEEEWKGFNYALVNRLFCLCPFIA